MTDAMFRRRDFAAAALLAFSPLLGGPANAKIKIVSGGKTVTSSSGRTSTLTKSITSTTSTKSASTTSTTTSTTLSSQAKTKGSTGTTGTTTGTGSSSVDACAYGAPLLDTHGRASFANRVWGLQRDTSKSYAIEQSTDLTLKRHRFEARSGDTWSGDAGAPRNRAEYCSTTREANGREVWFSYAMRLKAGPPVTNWNVLGQFHHTPDPGEGHSPPFSFNLIPGEKLRIVKRTDRNPLTTTDVNPTVMYERVMVRDHWYRMVGRIIFGWADNGACEIWIDGVKVVNQRATNIGFNDLVGPYWKFGIYRGASPDALVAEYANMEIGSTSLLSRVTSPLPIL